MQERRLLFLSNPRMQERHRSLYYTRVRWYGPVDDGNHCTTRFLEKQNGFSTTRMRIMAPLDGTRVDWMILRTLTGLIWRKRGHLKFNGNTGTSIGILK